MRKLVVAVIVLLAVFTFIREFPTSAGAAGIQNAAINIGQN